MTAASSPTSNTSAPTSAMPAPASTTSASACATSGVDHRTARIDLAAAFRWFARLDMHESVANHLSAAASADRSQFLINPRGRHFSRICASDLILLHPHHSPSLRRPHPPPPPPCYPPAPL